MRSVLIVILGALVACSSKKESPPKPAAIVARDAAGDTRLAGTPVAVRADKRVELLAIVNRLAGNDEYRRVANAYAADVDKAFAKFKGHAAVAETADLRKRGIAFDAPMVLAVYLDDHLQPIGTLPHRFAQVDFPAYATLLRDFAKASNFDAFFDAHAAQHAELVAKTIAMIGDDDVVGFYDEVFGARPNAHYTVVPSPLIGTHNYGVKNGEDLYQLLGDDASLALLVHEMGHSYINPIFANEMRLVTSGAALYQRFARRMDMQKYGNGEIVLNESGVRALTLLFMHDRKGPVAGAAAARDEQRAGFVWASELAEVFRKCRRDRSGDFMACMPKIVEFFDALVVTLEAKPPANPFIGPFNAVFWSEVGLVLPANPELRTYVAKLPIPKTDDLTGNVLAYGSPASNEWVKKAADWALWKITPEGIELGAKKFPGEHLVLIACWFRRDDPQHGVGVYAAADDSDLVGINSIRHGPRDWLVAKKTAKGFEIVETGDWRFENGAWVPFVPEHHL